MNLPFLEELLKDSGGQEIRSVGPPLMVEAFSRRVSALINPDYSHPFIQRPF